MSSHRKERILSTESSTTEDLDGAETVAYRGPCLSELLGSVEMRALSELEIDVEQTIMLAGSLATSRVAAPAPAAPLGEPRRSRESARYDTGGASSVSVAPVAYSVAQAIVADAPRGPTASRLNAFTFVAMTALASFLVGTWLVSEPLGSSPGLARHLAIHERVDDKTSLVTLKAPTAAAKRQLRRLPFKAGRATARRGAVAPVGPALTDEAAADEELIRAAQLERPF